MDKINRLPSIMFREVSELDANIIEQIADIHLKTFTGFFLSFLGKGFLKTLYQGFIIHRQSGLIIAYQNNKILGFLAYSEDLSGFYKFLIRKSFIPFAWYSFCAFIRKPTIMMRLLRAFVKPSDSKRSENYIGLSSIGVLPETKNQHIGSKLIDILKEKFDETIFSYIKIETDANDNDGVNIFYTKNGFQLINSYLTSEGRKMNEYRWYKNIER